MEVTPDRVEDGLIAGGTAPGRRSRVKLKIATATALGLGLAGGAAALAGATTGSAQSSSPAPGEGMPPGPGGGAPPAAVGTVQSVGSDSFVITTKDGSSVTVDVSSSTTYRDKDVSAATLANVTVGETVAAFGTLSSGVVTATSVGIGMPPGPGGGAPPNGSTSSQG
jgi:Domain of unknown function (DUF5666)